jgi:hypothetical protein
VLRDTWVHDTIQHLMQRPSIGEWLIPLILSAFALVTSWASHRMELTLPWAMSIYGFLTTLAVGAYFLRSWEYRRWRDAERRERAEEERTRRESYFDDLVECPGVDDLPHDVPRSELLDVNWYRGRTSKWLCAACWVKAFRETPQESSPRPRKFFRGER